jgi:FKBP-type peptidyl-prolyl cis-trans isomerase 2
MVFLWQHAYRYSSNKIEVDSGGKTMERIERDSIADIFFHLKWESEHAHHLEGYSARNVNLWRDWLPDRVNRTLLGKPVWEQTQVDFEPGVLFGNSQKPFKIDRKQFSMAPRAGRFYPQGRLSGIAGVFPQNIKPFRCVGINNGHMEVDLGHPLARYPLSLSMTVGQVSAKTDERGGSSTDWVGLLTDGPGMQARWQDTPTDFFSDAPFARKDEQADDRFYAQPRLVHHLDETARDMVANFYKRFVKDGMQVLDLMSSWASHLPEDSKPAGVSGLGLNPIELEQNPRLTDIRVHDLNANPVLPYD